ncbi:MAG: cob(I)yrinic acid a,c-diamide adenosyltransferase [Gammaproteobacteria bacterium]
MANRLSKIYTRTGDKGDTGLGDGSRVRKDHLRVETFGTVDELNSLIGLVLTHPIEDSLQTALIDIQHQLFDLGGELSVPGYQVISADHVTALEQLLDNLNADLQPLKEFILPGGCAATAYCHLARTVCRRAERRLVSLSDTENINQESLHYLNRLSDLLFVIARILNKQAGQPDVLWNHDRNSG